MVLERSALGESQLHDALVRLAGADQSIVRPNRNASPLPLLDHLRVSLFDESADMGERLAPPVVQFLDPRVDQPRRGFAPDRCALFHIVCTSFGCFSILRRYQSPIIRASLPRALAGPGRVTARHLWIDDLRQCGTRAVIRGIAAVRRPESVRACRETA